MDGSTITLVILGLLIFSVLCFKRALTLKKRHGGWVKSKEGVGHIGANFSQFTDSTKQVEPGLTMNTEDEVKATIESSLVRLSQQMKKAEMDKVDFHYEGAVLKVYKLLKNGNRYKRPIVTLFYNERNASGKWCVEVGGGRETFLLIDDAMTVLISTAKEMAS
ncbi:hypothetical protein [Marinomonas posidonica]|uniref:hypothetical protein n=1 Tax=Marinomonas posidonica TaxID=936476 RepID=UPI0037359DAF